MMNCFPCFTSQKSRNAPCTTNETNDDNVEHDEFRPPGTFFKFRKKNMLAFLSRNCELENLFSKNVVWGVCLVSVVATTKRTEEREPAEQQPPVKTFNFRELATATKNFRQECLLGEGGFGRVYKGTLQSTGQVCYHTKVQTSGYNFRRFSLKLFSIAL